MLDEHRENGHIHRPPANGADLAELLPADLEPIHERLAYDSDGWARRLPEAAALAEYARGLATGRATAIPLLEPDDERNGDDGDMPTASAGMPTGAPYEPFTQRRGRRPGPGRTLLALAAAVAVVALMAAVFNSLAPGRSPASGKPTANAQATSTAIPTATPRPPYGPIQGSWQADPSLQGLPDVPIFAPSNPSVVYETVFTGSTTSIPSGQDAVLQRSDDGGKTWRELSVPQPAFADVLNWGPETPLVSPTDPNVLLVGVHSQLSYSTATTCPSDLQTARAAPEHGGILAYGALDCAVQYVSTDGGGLWTPITVAGVSSLPVNGFSALYAQQGRYYATFYADAQRGEFGGYRVAASADGVHWSLVDSAAIATTKRVCGFIAAPTGTTIYAKTNDRSCAEYNGPADHLWRSDDMGLHWRDLGPLPYHFTGFMAAEQGLADAQPTLYLWTANTVGPTASGLTDQMVRFSTDGAYWRAAPAAGIPAGYQPYAQVPGTLSDGSVVMMYVAGSSGGGIHDPVTVGFFAWHAGDSEWHQVAPLLTISDRSNLSGGWNSFFVTPSGGVHGTVWHVQLDPTTRTYSVQRYAS